MFTERFDYIYCLNPRCSNPQNFKETQDCQTCRFPLYFQGRIHNYKAVTPLHQRLKGRLREIQDTSSYEGVDQQGRQYLLKVFNGNDAKISDLFKKEKEILMTLHHPNIPKLIDEFEYQVNRDSFSCLVIERIEGCNLEEWLDKHHKLSQETALKWMRQIVETLSYVHKNQFLHQDIKPSNIILSSSENRLYLVDFSQISDLVSPGYTPPEQANNSAIPPSDFYAMGMTFIHLLTGKHPLDLKNYQTKEIYWKPFAPQISDQFANLIDQLIEKDLNKRFHQASEILQELVRLENHNKFSPIIEKIKSAKWGILLILTFLAGFLIRDSLDRFNEKQSTIVENEKCLFSNRNNPLRSLGEKILFQDKKEINQALQKAQEAINNCNLDIATQQLDNFLQKYQNSPEARIYFNNLKVTQTSKRPIHIVVSLPLIQDSDLEVLRGVAMAQEINNNNKNRKHLLLVEIAKDRDDKATVPLLAQTLVDDPDILAVVGHRSSDVSKTAAPIYQKGGLVMISPTSTSKSLSQFDEYIFRVVPNDEILGRILAQFITREKNLDSEQLLICYDPSSDYSKSFAVAVHNELHQSAIKPENFQTPCNLKPSDYNPQNIISEIKKTQVKGVVLIPSTKPDVQNQAIDLAKTIQNSDLQSVLFGSDSMYTWETWNKGRLAVQDMFLSVPWYPEKNSDFAQNAKEIWGENITITSWRTFMAYDAAWTIIEAANRSDSPSRENIKQILSNEGFEFNGETGQVKFLANGDRKATACIVKIVDPKKEQEKTPFELVGCNDF